MVSSIHRGSDGSNIAMPMLANVMDPDKDRKQTRSDKVAAN